MEQPGSAPVLDPGVIEFIHGDVAVGPRRVTTICARIAGFGALFSATAALGHARGIASGRFIPIHGAAGGAEPVGAVEPVSELA